MQVDRHREVLAGPRTAHSTSSHRADLPGARARWRPPAGPPCGTAPAPAPRARCSTARSWPAPTGAGGHAAKFDHPVVVDPAARFIQRRVARHPPGRAEGGVEHLGADAVVRLVLEPSYGSAAGAHRPAGGVARTMRKARARSRSAGGSRFSHRSGGSVSVRVAWRCAGRGLWRRGSLVSRWHQWVWERAGFLHSMARCRPLPKTVARVHHRPLLRLMRNRATDLGTARWALPAHRARFPGLVHSSRRHAPREPVGIPVLTGIPRRRPTRGAIFACPTASYGCSSAHIVIGWALGYYNLQPLIKQ